MTSPACLSKIYTARRVTSEPPLTIDGRGSSPVWDQAEVLTDFSFPWSDQPPPLTEFRALWDNRSLYFRYDVVDDDVVLGRGADSRQKVIGSDRVEIFFSTGPDLNPYYGLEIDPRGEVLDYEATYHRRMRWDWSCPGLVVRTSRHERGYVVEGQIPRSTFCALNCLQRDDAGDYLLAGLYRAEFRHAEDGKGVIEDWMSWVDPQVPTPDFHVPSSFGTIRWAE